MQNCRTCHCCWEGRNILGSVGPLVAEGYRLWGPIMTWVGVDGGVLIVQWIMMGAGHTLHAMIVQVCCEIVDMYHLPISHGGEGDGDTWHEGGGGSGQGWVGGGTYQQFHSKPELSWHARNAQHPSQSTGQSRLPP